MIEFVKNIKPTFDLSMFNFKVNRLKLNNKYHPENKAIKGLFIRAWAQIADPCAR